MKIKQMRVKRTELAAVVAKANEDLAKVYADARAGGRDLSAEELAKEKQLKASKALTAKEIELLDEQIAEAAQAAESERLASPFAVSEVTDPAKKDRMRGFRSPRDYITAVARAAESGQVDPRLRPLATAGSDEHSTFDNPNGGFWVPEGMSPNLLMVENEADPIAPLVTRLPMDAPSVKVRARTDKDHSTSVTGGLRVYRREEAGEGTASRMKTEMIQLSAHSLIGVTYETEELLRDSPSTFAALLALGFGQEFGAKRFSERLSGTGVGEFLGVLKAPCLVSIAKEAGQAADTINWTNLIKMRARCWRYGSAVWHANHDTLPQLMAITQPGSTIPLFTQDAQGVDRLFGRPIYFTEFAETVGDQGDIMLGNWSQYLEADYQMPEQAESIHVRFLTNERTFRFTARNDGQPWWRTALTPKKGANTLSPFVALDARA